MVVVCTKLACCTRIVYAQLSDSLQSQCGTNGSYTSYTQSIDKICGSRGQKSNIILLCAYFDRITTFETLQYRTSIKGGAHTCSVNACTPDKSM